MQDRPDTVPIPSPRTAKENVRELRALRRRVEELQSKLRVSGTAKTSPRSTKSDTYRAMAQSCSSPEIQRRCNGSLAESNSVAAMTSRDQGYQIESAEPVSNSGGTMQSLRGAPCTTPPASPPGRSGHILTHRMTTLPDTPTARLRRTKSRTGRKKPRIRPAASFSTPMGEIENTFIQRLGISVAEVMQRLVTDEVLHAVDARHIHRLLASNDKTARDVVMQLEQAGTVTCRAQY